MKISIEDYLKILKTVDGNFYGSGNLVIDEVKSLENAKKAGLIEKNPEEDFEEYHRMVMESTSQVINGRVSLETLLKRFDLLYQKAKKALVEAKKCNCVQFKEWEKGDITSEEPKNIDTVE